MKSTLSKILLYSALLPSTILFIIGIIMLFVDVDFKEKLIPITGIIGYWGLFLLSFKDETNKYIILILLCMWLSAIILGVSKIGFDYWVRVISFVDPLVSILIIWPITITAINIYNVGVGLIQVKSSNKL